MMKYKKINILSLLKWKKKKKRTMNKELKSYAKSKLYFLLVAWIVILILNTILMLIALNCEYGNISTSISLMTPVIIIFYGLIWWISVNVEFNKKKMEV